VGGQRVIVGHEEKAVVFILHLNKIAQRAKIVAQVKITGGTDTAAYYFSTHFNYFFVVVDSLALADYDI